MCRARVQLMPQLQDSGCRDEPGINLVFVCVSLISGCRFDWLPGWPFSLQLWRFPLRYNKAAHFLSPDISLPSPCCASSSPLPSPPIFIRSIIASGGLRLSIPLALLLSLPLSLCPLSPSLSFYLPPLHRSVSSSNLIPSLTFLCTFLHLSLQFF